MRGEVSSWCEGGNSFSLEKKYIDPIKEREYKKRRGLFPREGGSGKIRSCDRKYYKGRLSKKKRAEGGEKEGRYFVIRNLSEKRSASMGRLERR